MLSYQRGFGFLAALLLILIAWLVFGEVITHSAWTTWEPIVFGASCGSTASISNVTVTDITSTTATVSWQTNVATESCLNLDSAIHQIFPSSRPVSQTFQGVAYAPGEYDNYLNWVDRDVVADTIISDIEAIASANFNGIVLYPAGPSDRAIHPWDQIVLDVAATHGLSIAFRLEWYPASFNWETTDCDNILDYYDMYLSYFEAQPDRLLYFLINMPLDDTKFLYPNNPTIKKQRDYVSYCYSELQKRVPGATVYANTYYGWKDELHQAPVGDLVDGVSVVIYAQHADGAPFNCNVLPTASHPAATLICKDQFDYYLDKAWSENDLEDLDKPLVLDSTGFAPPSWLIFLPVVMAKSHQEASSPSIERVLSAGNSNLQDDPASNLLSWEWLAANYNDPVQGNGMVAGSWAKVRAIEALRRYLSQDVRLYGWSYFKLLHKDEADWGLIDRRQIADSTVTTSHQLILNDLFPATPYSFTLQAGDTISGVYTFATSVPPAPTNLSPLITITWPPYGHELVPPGAQLTITWLDDDPDNNAAIELYYDRENAGCDGMMIEDGLYEDSGIDSHAWGLPPALPIGSYYIYGRINDGTNPVECDYSSGRFVPSTETLEVVSTTSTITLDGAMDETIWQSAIPLTYAIHNSQADLTTASVQALWDQDYLYLGFDVMDAQVETAAQDWNDDSVSAVFNNGEFRCRQDVGGTGEGECDRVILLPQDCTFLDDPDDEDCGYTVEMRIQWSKVHITANPGDVIPVDFLSVDHDKNPGAPYHDPGTEFSKLSWDGDDNVDTTGRSLSLGGH